MTPVPHLLRGWKYWLPGYLAAAALACLLKPSAAHVHWSEHVLFYASYALAPFLMGYWLTAALTPGYKPLARSIAGLVFSCAFLAWSLAKG